jgi:AraC family transcriptional regulator of adaptative response / DNA-3-methyladenine glycosylase II
MRLIADGVVDRDGVRGLASRLGYSERHISRELVAVAGAGPLAIARAHRAQTARVLIETTDLPITEVAFAAGFQSVRQFNAVIQEVFATTPRQLREGARGPTGQQTDGAVALRLPYRAPLDGAGLIAFLGRRAVPGVEEVVGSTYRRSLRLPHGPGVVELTPDGDHVRASVLLEDLRDLGAAVQRCRALFDLDSDPVAVTESLGADAVLGRLVRATPGRRVPGHVDGHELALRAVLGQQVSLASAATLAARLVTAYGETLAKPVGGVTHLFPTAVALADAQPRHLAMPQGRRRCVHGLARALASGDLIIDVGTDRDETMRRLHEVPGVGPWTVGYIAMRALRDPDVFLPTDLGVRHALELLGRDGSPAEAARLAERWRPYRAYAVQHLWAHLPGTASAVGRKKGRAAA